MATPDLQRLADRVIARRESIGLSSVRKAAVAAGISKDTWTRVEKAESVRAGTYDAVEKALLWVAGSCRKILNGGEAVPLDSEAADDGIFPVPPEMLEAEIRDAVQGALIASTDDMTAAQIRQVNERAVQVLRSRGILPSKD